MHNDLPTVDWLRLRAKSSPSRLALITQTTCCSWVELDARVDELSCRLQGIGIHSDTVVACWITDSVAFIEIMLAMARLGAVLVPLNTRLTPAEIDLQLQRLDCRLLLASGEAALELRNAVAYAQVHSLSELPISSTRLTEAPFSLERTQAVLFTSGTSGTPRAAMLTFGNHFFSAISSAERLGVLPDDRWLLCMPLFHVGGMAIIWRACLFGFSIVVLDGFDEQAVLDAASRHRPTIISLVPTMLERLMRHPAGAAALMRFRVILLGGAGARSELLAAGRAAGLRIAATYGLTEAASQVSTGFLPESPVADGFVGRPILFAGVRVIDESGTTLPENAVGEICVCGPVVMKGYASDPDAASRAIRDGELRTGDMGYLDEQGNLFVLQRRTDLILSGGENVYPAEVERVLATHPAVAEAVVVGIPDPEWGQSVAAAVVLRSPAGDPVPALSAYCRSRLAGYKCPRRFLYLDSLPTKASGKIDRIGIAELFAGELERAG